MHKAFKFRAYPTASQRELIDKTFGCCRLIYNKGLELRKSSFSNGVKINYYGTAEMLKELKGDSDFSFLKEVDSIALQQSLRDLDRAYKYFFSKKNKYPKYKTKHNYSQSYRTINQRGSIRIVGKYIKLPKIGYLKIRQTRDVENIGHVTVEKTSSGKYFVSIDTTFEPEIRTNDGCMIGIDVGIKEFYTDSNGNVVDNPKHLEKSARKLARAQRKFSKKQKGSNNWDKQRIKVSRIHEKIANQRNDFLQKLTTSLIRENQTICVEDLNIKGMVHNHRLARSILSVSWAKFFEMLDYKALWYGNEIIRIPTTYPSSQICSCCGYRNKNIKNLKIRSWECPICHSKNNRDINAAANILQKGLSLMA